MASRTHRAAVIGSGFGGLAAAIRLRCAGIDTVIYEARERPGGRAYVFEDEGFTFDAGPTVITAPQCIAELFELAGRDMADYVELLPVQPFYRLLWDSGERFDYTNDEEKLLAQIRARNPRDVEGYRQFLEYSRQVYEKGYAGMVDTAFLRFWDMVKVAPDLLKLRADRSVYSTVSRFIEDERLREAFSFNSLLIGGSPFESSSIYTLIHYLERHGGVFFPKGGTHALVRGLVKLFEDLGGELRLADPVREIVPMDATGGTHRITSARHEAEPYDIVVSNADVHHLFSKLLSGDGRAKKTARQLEKMRWSMSLFLVYFGVDRTYDDLAHHTVVFGPRYKGLIDQIFHGSELQEDFSVYLHAPTVTDPSLAPPGCTTFYALSPVPHLGNAPIDWQTVGPQYADRILGHLERWLPDLRKHVVTKRIFTPSDFERELGAFQGNGFSVAPVLTQSAWFRPHNRHDAIPNLYIVGAGTHPGAGVPGVINSAKATMGVIARDLAL